MSLVPVAPESGGWALLVVPSLVTVSRRPQVPLFYCFLPPTPRGTPLAVHSTWHRLWAEWNRKQPAWSLGSQLRMGFPASSSWDDSHQEASPRCGVRR